MESSVTDLTAPTHEPVDASGPVQPAVSQRTVALGVGCVAAVVGYTVYRSYLPIPPQALYRCVGGGDEIERAPLACVNFDEDKRAAMLAALPALSALKDDSAVSFPTVTFYDDTPELTISGVRESTRAATLFAFRELNKRHHDGLPTACALWQTAVELNGEPLEVGHSNAQLLQRAHGHALCVLHCLGFCADGTGAVVIERDVCGLVDSRLAARRWQSAEQLERQSASTVLQYCCVPSETTFSASARRRYHSSDTVVRVSKDDKVPLQTPNAVDRTVTDSGLDTLTRLWQSPLPLLWVFVTALRYARVEDGGVGALLACSSRAESPLAKLQRVGRRLLTWSGVAHGRSPDVPRADLTHTTSAQEGPETEAIDVLPSCTARFAIALVTRTDPQRAGSDAVHLWETQVSSLVAKVTQRRLTDIVLSLDCSSQRGAGGTHGITFELPVKVSLVEALTVALGTVGLLSCSGIESTRVLVAARIVSNVAPLSTASVVGYVPFQSGSGDLLFATTEVLNASRATLENPWCIMVDVS